MVIEVGVQGTRIRGGSGFWARYRRSWLVVGATIIVVGATFASLLGRSAVDPFAYTDASYASPSIAHWFGTDGLGRDVFAQVLWGIQPALVVGLGSALLAGVIGTAIGAVGGYFGGFIDGFLMRATDITMTLPTFFIALLVGILFGGSIPLITVVLGLVSWTGTARVIRAEVLAQKSRGYVEAARAAGAGDFHVLVREVLPNSLHPAIALISLVAAWSILAEAGLSFLGLRDPSEVTWGWMLQTALSNYRAAWWMAVFPGAALSIFVFSFNMIGDGINDALNPRVREGRRRGSGVRSPLRFQGGGDGEHGDRVLDVEHLSIAFPIGRSTARVVDDASFHVDRGEMVGLVGESGSGKTMTALAAIGLIPTPGYVADGRIVVGGIDVVGASGHVLTNLRLRKVALAFQDPQSALNPLMTVGNQIGEALIQQGMTREEARGRAVEAMEEVRIGAPQRRARAFPHQLSGGMRQRVLLAIAWVREPELLIVDEPTTALDVITQQQVMDLLRGPVAARRIGVLVISHDVSVVAQTCDRAVVMYGGAILESARTAELLRAPRHPYTQGLIRSVPTLTSESRRLAAIPGSLPQALDMPSGCRFHPRCPAALARCRTDRPDPWLDKTGHMVACWLYGDDVVVTGGRDNVWDAEEAPE